MARSAKLTAFFSVAAVYLETATTTTSTTPNLVLLRPSAHDVTTAILVFQNNETAAMLVYQDNPVLNSFLM